jgi:hypothetical protein
MLHLEKKSENVLTGWRHGAGGDMQDISDNR